jgi:hypothetical protein
MKRKNVRPTKRNYYFFKLFVDLNVQILYMKLKIRPESHTRRLSRQTAFGRDIKVASSLYKMYIGFSNRRENSPLFGLFVGG